MPARGPWQEGVCQAQVCPVTHRRTTWKVAVALRPENLPTTLTVLVPHTRPTPNEPLHLPFMLARASAGEIRTPWTVTVTCSPGASLLTVTVCGSVARTSRLPRARPSCLRART